MSDPNRDWADSLVRNLNDPDWRARVRAEEALVRLGEGAFGALAEALCRESEPSEAVLRILLRLRPLSAPVFRRAAEEGSPAVRIYAIEGLVELEDLGSVERVCRCLVDPDAGVRTAALGALHHWGAAALPGVRRAAAEGKLSLRRAAIRLLGAIGEETDLPFLEGCVGDPDPGVRTAAVSALMQLRKGDWALSLAQGLADADLEVRRQAARALSMVDAPESVKEVGRELAGLGDPHGCERAAETLADYLRTPGIPEVIASLVPNDVAFDLFFHRLQSSDGEVRRGAHTGLSGLVLPVEPLARLLHHRNPDIRKRAGALLLYCGERAAGPMAGALLQAEPVVARELEELLVRCGEAAVGPLCEIVAYGPPPAQRTAVRLLGELAHPAAIPTLIKLLERGTQPQAAAALGQIAAAAPHVSLREAIPVLRRKIAPWAFEMAEHVRVYRRVLIAIEKATDRLKDLPLTAHRSASPADGLPRPAHSGEETPVGLPIPGEPDPPGESFR